MTKYASVPSWWDTYTCVDDDYDGHTHNTYQRCIAIVKHTARKRWMEKYILLKDVDFLNRYLVEFSRYLSDI